MKQIGIVVLAAVFAVPGLAAGEKSDAKVKAKAEASKIGADGKQTITLTLEVEKGWYIYANPLNANTKSYEGNETVVNVKGKDKIEARVKYPVGVKHKDGKYEYDVYEGKVVVELQVQRTPGDTGPLQIAIDVNACKAKVCLLGGTVKLTVP